jgi:hypothetical protein
MKSEMKSQRILEHYINKRIVGRAAATWAMRGLPALIAMFLIAL